MDDNFKSKKRSTGEKIMDRLKSDTKLSDEVKQKIQARMQHAKDAGNDSDSEAGSDDNDESDSDMADEKGRSERGNDSFVSTRSKISSMLAICGIVAQQAGLHFPGDQFTNTDIFGAVSSVGWAGNLQVFLTIGVVEAATFNMHYGEGEPGEIGWEPKTWASMSGSSQE